MVDGTASPGSLSSIIFSSLVCGDQFSAHLHAAGAWPSLSDCVIVCFKNALLFNTILDQEHCKSHPSGLQRGLQGCASPPSPVVRAFVDTWLSSARPARALSPFLMTVESSLWHPEKRPPRTWVRLPLLSLFNNDLSDPRQSTSGKYSQPFAFFSPLHFVTLQLYSKMDWICVEPSKFTQKCLRNQVFTASAWYKYNLNAF